MDKRRQRGRGGGVWRKEGGGLGPCNGLAVHNLTQCYNNNNNNNNKKKRKTLKSNEMKHHTT